MATNSKKRATARRCRTCGVRMVFGGCFTPRCPKNMRAKIKAAMLPVNPEADAIVEAAAARLAPHKGGRPITRSEEVTRLREENTVLRAWGKRWKRYVKQQRFVLMHNWDKRLADLHTHAIENERDVLRARNAKLEAAVREIADATAAAMSASGNAAFAALDKLFAAVDAASALATPPANGPGDGDVG